jgi:NitT/TauT family transport system ATP-binding protein
VNSDRIGPEFIISARGVSKRFGRGQDMTALDSIDLDIRQGEFLCLIGPSGCGKSTLLYMLAGLVACSSGTLLMDGKPIGGPSRERGLVFQEDALFPWMSVAENVAFGLRVRAAGRRSEEEIGTVVGELLRLVGLRGFEASRPGQLSGGMKQRAAIAACLATEPRVLLMDEPFGALDMQTRGILQRELLRIHETIGRTTVFVTHDINEAILLADRVVVLSARPGRLKALLEVPLPRPRSEGVARKEEYLAFERQLRDLMENDIAGSRSPEEAVAETVRR